MSASKNRSSAPLRSLVFLAPLLLAAGCVSSAPSSPDGGSARADRKEKEKKEDEEKAFKLRVAKAELAIAEKRNEMTQAQAEVAVNDAELALEEAKRELEKHVEVDGPAERERAQLALDRAKGSLEEETFELQQLREDYGVHDVGRTGEIVIQRQERDIDFAKRRLALAQKELDWLTEHELPAKRAELEEAVAAARRAHADAKTELALGQLEWDLEHMKSKREIEEMEKDDDDEEDEGGDEEEE